jgi:hypothetical protein
VAAAVGGIAVVGWFSGIGGGVGEPAPPQLTEQEWRDTGGVNRAVLGYHVAACRSSDPLSNELADHCFTWHGLRGLRAWVEADTQFISGVQRYAEMTSR